mmetsp:Transcript_17294/g.42366  ORF Transcript_17294/g.42366 Transcript_17294/m.42366 type:complete len:712 (+) Transcript_17294:91-2226(+)
MSLLKFLGSYPGSESKLRRLKRPFTSQALREDERKHKAARQILTGRVTPDVQEFLIDFVKNMSSQSNAPEAEAMNVDALEAHTSRRGTGSRRRSRRPSRARSRTGDGTPDARRVPEAPRCPERTLPVPVSRARNRRARGLVDARDCVAEAMNVGAKDMSNDPAPAPTLFEPSARKLVIGIVNRVGDVVKEQRITSKNFHFPQKKKGCRARFKWLHKAAMLWVLFKIWDGKMVRDASNFVESVGFNVASVRKLLSRQADKNKWIPIVEDMTFEDVSKYFPDYCSALPFDQDSTVRVPEKYLKKDGRQVLTKYTRAHGKKRETRLMCFLAKRYSQKYLHISADKFTAREGRRKSKYPEAETFVRTLVTNAWNQGRRVTAFEIECEMRSHFRGTKFYKNYFEIDNLSRFCNWRTRTLSRYGFSVRQKTISQSVPDDWADISQEAAEGIRYCFMAQNCGVIVNADQTFMRFHPGADSLIAPVGRKNGVTLMVTVELEGSRILPPFWVFQGKTGARIDQEFANFEQENNGAHVAFQPMHRFDSAITCRYLRWLRRQYPNRKIGLVWDMAPQHASEQVLKFIRESREWLVVTFIPGGLTSILQPCDLVVNSALKKRVKKKYAIWKHTQLARDRTEKGHKTLKLSRKKLVQISLDVIRELNLEQRNHPTIRNCFRDCGLDPFSYDEDKHLKHLKKFKANSIKKTLFENQMQMDLEAKE